MNNSDTLKQFNISAKSYYVTRNGEIERQIEKSLQVLAATADVAVFDPGQKETVEFFANLHEIMIGLDPSSSLAWTAVASLKEACRNASARFALIHTYKFVPVLTRFLSSKPSPEKEIELLKLIEELTYGIKISWQEAHLPRLISTLTKLISSDSDEEKVTLALSVLVNLCYKNLPAVYSLMRSIDLKKFIKTVLQLQHHNESSNVQICKLMIILKAVTGGLPELDVNTYLKSVCPTLMIALRQNNVCLMRQTVDFYKEMASSANDSRSQLRQSNSNSCEEINQLILLVRMNNEVNAGCVDILFEYLCDVVCQGCLNIEELYPAILEVAFSWVCNEGVAKNALHLISSITRHLPDSVPLEDNTNDKSNLTSQVYDVVEQQLSVVLLLLNTNSLSNDSYHRLTALLHFLSRMVNVSKFTEKILSSLDPQYFRNLFEQLSLPNQHQNSLFQEPIYTFYIKALIFLQELSDKETSWLILYNELLLQRQIQYILSIALFVGSQSVKMSVLKLTTTPGFSHECLELLAGCLSELNNLVIFSPSGCKRNDSVPTELGFTPMDITPLMTVTQEGHLNRLLEKFERDNAKNEKSETSAIMELYQFKAAAMSQTIRNMQSSQEAADKRATDLQHNLAMTTSEISRLHHLLHSTQQSFEAATKEKSLLSGQINEIQLQANDLHLKHSQAIQNLRSKTRMISEISGQLEEAKSSISSLTEEKNHLNLRLEEEIKIKDDLRGQVSDLQGQLESTALSLSECKKELACHKKELGSVNQKLDQLKKDYLNQTAEYSKLEKAKAESDAEAADLNKQLTIISQLAMKRKVDK